MRYESQLKITKHAYKRAKERLGWSRKALDRMLSIIHEYGFTRHEAKGELKKYMLKQRRKYKSKAYARVYGEVIYFFRDRSLITLYRLDNEYIKYLVISKAA
ncbi:MAG: hypothetical protein AAGI23_15490 [Bacteroidota bacterium]